MEKIEKYILNILSPIVDHPEQINLKITQDEFWIFVLLSVHETDLPKIIGKKWIYLSSLRYIVRSFWFSINKRINIKILEE